MSNKFGFGGQFRKEETMKTEQEIRKFLAEISAKIDHMYHEIKQGNASEGDCGGLLGVLLTREDMLEWVLEEAQNGEDS